MRTYHLHNNTQVALGKDAIVVWTESVVEELATSSVYLKTSDRFY